MDDILCVTFQDADGLARDSFFGIGRLLVFAEEADEIAVLERVFAIFQCVVQHEDVAALHIHEILCSIDGHILAFGDCIENRQDGLNLLSFESIRLLGKILDILDKGGFFLVVCFRLRCVGTSAEGK